MKQDPHKVKKPLLLDNTHKYPLCGRSHSKSYIHSHTPGEELESTFSYQKSGPARMVSAHNLAVTARDLKTNASYCSSISN